MDIASENRHPTIRRRARVCRVVESSAALHNLNFRCIATALVRNFRRQSAIGYRAVVGIEAVRETNRPTGDARHLRKALAVTVTGCTQRREPTAAAAVDSHESWRNLTNDGGVMADPPSW